MRLAQLITVVAIAALCVTGCSDDSSPTGAASTLDPEFVGTWDYQAVTVNGQSVPVTTILIGGSSVSASMTLGSNFSYLYEERDGSSTVMWTRTGTLGLFANTYTLRVTDENGSPIPTETDTGTWAMLGDVLTITVDNIPETIVITYTKR